MIVRLEKDIVDLVQRGATSEAEKRIVALRVAAMTAQLEIATLKERIDRLERELQVRETLSFDGTYYWMGAEHARDGPFCPTCYDTEHLTMRLQYKTVEEIDYETGDSRLGSQFYFKCPRCSMKLQSPPRSSISRSTPFNQCPRADG